MAKAVMSVATAAVLVAPIKDVRTHPQVPCPMKWWQGSWHVERLIRCEAHKLNVSAPKAIRVARCESRFYPRASNGRFSGVYQIGDSEWKGWWQRWVRVPYWTHKLRGRIQGRANVITALFHAHHYGWGAWSCQ